MWGIIAHHSYYRRQSTILYRNSSAVLFIYFTLLRVLVQKILREGAWVHPQAAMLMYAFVSHSRTLGSL